LGFLCDGLLGTCFFAVHTFSGARSEICQLALCCQHVMLVCWLFFNFVTSFDFGCCSLAQEMKFLDCYLPYFRQQLITCPLLAGLPLQSLFTETSHGDQLLAPPPSSSALRAPPCPLCCMFLFSSLFVIQFGFFFLLLFIFLLGGEAVGILHAACLLTCWSARCLPSRFGTSIWRHGSPLVFLV
jgi:hypothetical protein